MGRSFRRHPTHIQPAEHVEKEIHGTIHVSLCMCVSVSVSVSVSVYIIMCAREKQWCDIT